MRPRAWSLLASCSLLVACSAAQHELAAPVNAVQPGAPECMPIDADPNGLYWDVETQALLIADAAGNRILKWTEAGGIVPFVALPAVDAGAGLGQIAEAADGSWIVTRFGKGNAGGVVRVSPSGDAVLVRELAPERRRIGVTVSSDGRIFDTWFTRGKDHEGTGAVSELDLEGGETDVVTGLAKPVAVLALGDKLLISDQGQGQLLQTPLSAPASTSVFATLAEPDALAAGPDGSVFAGSRANGVYRVDSAGSVSVALPSKHQIRGVAYDPAKRRLFASEHDGDDKDGVQNALCILMLGSP